MKVTIAKSAGFCFGVSRAAEKIEELLQASDKKVYTFGELIHNRIYNDSLAKRGVNIIESLEEARKIAESNVPSVVVIRTHGVPKEISETLFALAAKHKNFQIADMTCPFVMKIHKIAEEETNESSVLFLLATEGHPESIGIVSHAVGKVITFQYAEQLEKLTKPYLNGNFCMLLASQTTQNHEEFKKSKLFFKKHFTNAKIFDTICNVTDIRQKEAAALSATSDLMLVIGGKNSSNSRKLFDICLKNCKKTFFVEDATEIDGISLDGTEQNIGITAGASTPAALIKEIEYKWKK